MNDFFLQIEAVATISVARPSKVCTIETERERERERKLKYCQKTN